MPKPLYPPHGGPYPPAFKPTSPTSAASTRTSDRASDQSAERDPEPGSRIALEAEIGRLRQELAEVQETNLQEVRFSLRPIPMTWVALVLCGSALIFAVIALLQHG